jgi:hypothetical protein
MRQRLIKARAASNPLGQTCSLSEGFFAASNGIMSVEAAL